MTNLHWLHFIKQRENIHFTKENIFSSQLLINMSRIVVKHITQISIKYYPSSLERPFDHKNQENKLFTFFEENSLVTVVLLLDKSNASSKTGIFQRSKVHL